MPSRAGRGLALVRREVRFDTGGRLYGAVPGLRSLPGFARARSARRDLAGPPADRTDVRVLASVTLVRPQHPEQRLSQILSGSQQLTPS